MTTAPSTTKQIRRLGTLLLPLLLLGTPGAARAFCPRVDFCHQAPFLNPSTQQCDKGPFTGCSIVAVRDAMLLLSDRNTNEGANTALWIQEQGPRRITLRFPLAACANDATRLQRDRHRGAFRRHAADVDPGDRHELVGNRHPGVDLQAR